MPKPSPISDVRRNISLVFSRAVQHHQPVFVQRGSRELGSFFGLDELERLLQAYDFHPEVFFEAGGVNIWLPELEIYGRGATFEDAHEDLLEEVRDYVEEYLEAGDEYLRAPNRGRHFPFVLSAAVADLRDALAETVFRPPADASEGHSDPASLGPDPVWASPRPGERCILLSVADEEWSSMSELLSSRKRVRVVELSNLHAEEPKTYAEAVAPIFGARPAARPRD